jgi:hypothetical protein
MEDEVISSRIHPQLRHYSPSQANESVGNWDVYLLKKLGKHRPEAESRSGIDTVVQSTLRIGEPSPAPRRF